jgi:hypothetical protein
MCINMPFVLASEGERFRETEAGHEKARAEAGFS